MRMSQIIFATSLMTSALAVLFLAIFYTAFFSPSMRVIVDINHFGEAWWEYFIFLPFLVASGVGPYYSFKMLRDDR